MALVFPIPLRRLIQRLVILVVSLVPLAPAFAQQVPADLSAKEQAACRPDAIKLCFFSIPNSDALRACLRRNKPSLSDSCRKLIESRGN